MKYLKEELDIKRSINTFKNFFSKNHTIDDICNKYGIENYTIKDGLVNVEGSVDLSKYKSLQFGDVSGNFNCQGNNLTTLIGCPKSLDGGYLRISNNPLTSLEGCPKYISGILYATETNIETLDYFPRHANEINLWNSPIYPIFQFFIREIYDNDGGEFFSTSGTFMDYFWDCDPIYPGKIIIK